MTKAEFRSWFQGVLNDTEVEFDGIEDNYGDVWRRIENEGMLEDIRVPYAVDRAGHDIIFKLEDGMLAIVFGVGIEGETQLWIPGRDVEYMLRDYSVGELDNAIGAARVSLNDLTILSMIA